MFYIYEIKNNINNKTYIGQRLCPKNKTLETDKYMGSGTYLSKAKNKYGVENFTKMIIAVCETKEYINILEKIFIKLYREQGKAEYNIADGGMGGFLGDEVSNLMKKSWKENYNERIKIFNSEEYKEKVHEGLVKAHKDGKFDNVFTDDVRLKKSISAKKSWEKNGDKFREQRKTEKYKKSVSEAKKGIPVPEERKLKISESVKKLHNDSEYRKRFLENCKKNSEKLKGRICVTIDGKHKRLFEKDIPENAIRGWV